MDPGGFHRFNFRFGGATAAADNSTGMPHTPPGRCSQTGNKADHRFAHFFGHKCGGFFLCGAADFTDHHNPLGIRIFFKGLKAVDEVGADDRITADADAGALPDSL